MRLSIALLTLIVTATSLPHASACCLTRWLYGRPAPYAVGYAPQPYAVGYAPQPYAVGYAPLTAPYAANYPATTTTSVLRPSWSTAAPVLTSGVYQAQRPTYYDNPSVYTGLPVTGPAVPVAAGYRGTAAASANRYPDTYAAAQVPISAPGLPLTVTTPTGAPATTLPVTPVAPLFPPTPPRPSGLSRFFGSAFSTNYRTAYYQAPVTYYRPATTVDPISGTTVTVQQPCTSYVQQVQRTPYSSLQAAPTTISPAPPAGYGTPGCGTPGCGASYSATPGIGAPASVGAVGQVSGIAAPTPGQFTTPIPATAPATPAPGTYYGPSNQGPNTNQGLNTNPLTGAPQGANGSDLAPVDQPQLRNRPPAENGTGGDINGGGNSSNQKSYWELQNADDSTAMIRRPQSIAEPIHAPQDYVAPFARPADAVRPMERGAIPVNDRQLEAPPLPPRTFDSVDSGNEGNWVNVRVREASTAQVRADRVGPAPPQRDTTWTPVR